MRQMARLPQPGGDSGEWGEILNDFLGQSHNADGSLKTGIISTSQLAGDVTSTLNSKASISSLSTVATSGSYADLSNKPTIPSQSVISVSVSTGAEARPSATTVLWVGGAAQPTNMAVGDLWFSPDPPADTLPPSAPIGVSASNIISSGFRLSWSASTDNLGVTGYEVILDGLSYAIVAGTSATITARQQNTTYNCQVRARDANGNWSALSTTIQVTTLVSTNTEHSIYDSTTYPGILQYPNGNQITVASGFYTGLSGTTGWNLTKVRLYVPGGATTPSTTAITVFTPLNGAEPDLSSPVRSATMNLIAGGWNTVTLSTPVALTPGTPFWVGYRFADGSYFSSSSIGSAYVKASDGSEVYLAQASIQGNVGRNYWRENSTTNGSSVSGQGYGLDVIVSEV